MEELNNDLDIGHTDTAPIFKEVRHANQPSQLATESTFDSSRQEKFDTANKKKRKKTEFLNLFLGRCLCPTAPKSLFLKFSPWNLGLFLEMLLTPHMNPKKLKLQALQETLN
ncbi:hypothetical protein SAY87_001023 [Trapa incisa]|uniref:Uncharacterized protein n=1 Tax=Trapa incisa TaxID=236973 RepID=A0AAN7GUP0_9MYRT|nr:hypothetical protein SAY87_001023 [Trapa incisa]